MIYAKLITTKELEQRKKTLKQIIDLDLATDSILREYQEICEELARRKC